MQLDLFDPNPTADRPDLFGPAEVLYADAANILHRPAGRLAAVDFSLNPYQGCTFACTYCYAAFFAPEDEQRERWGQWVRVKTNAVEKLRNMRLDLRGKTVLMSSATDPYQPIERRLELTRSLLPILARRGVNLTVQTRSPIAARDIDLFQQFDSIRVNLSITTDSEAVRRRFEPQCASIEQRLAAVTEIAAAGIRTGIGVSPLLPLEHPAEFARQIIETGVSSVRIGTFHETKREFAAGTRQPALDLARELGWTKERQQTVKAELHHHLAQLGPAQRPHRRDAA